MNWDYISGFFDADGSITAIVTHAGCNKVIQVSFHNNEINILDEIKQYIFDSIGIKGNISKKKVYKPNHNIQYELKYSYRNGLKVANKLTSIHPKKAHRIKIYNLIQDKTNRNGKYTMSEKLEREVLINEFFKSNY